MHLKQCIQMPSNTRKLTKRQSPVLTVKCRRSPRLTSRLLFQSSKQKGAKVRTHTMSLFGSPDSLKAKNLVKDDSLYVDPDTKDSGYSEDNREEVSTLLSSLTSEDTVLTFPSEGIASSSIESPNVVVQQPTKKRLWFNSPLAQSPSVITTNGLKKLRLFDLKDDCTGSEKFVDIPEETGSLLAVEECTVPQSSTSQYALSGDRGELVKEAVEKSETEELIGDFSKSHALPLVPGSHPDLKCITPETLKGVLDGEYSKVVKSFKIIDSRYPYEYSGGHIKGAKNVYKMENCFELLDVPMTAKDERHILIFHCEFSKERGPTMVRNLRKEDRTRNASNYPALVYPEVYILEGGYKKFFQAFPEYCDPTEYTKMLDPTFEEELKFFKQQCKNSETVTGTSKKGRPGKVIRAPISVRKTLSSRF